MKAAADTRRERVRAMLADLKMPGALEVVDEILAQADGGTVTATEAIEQLLSAHIVLRNNRRLQTAMRSSRLTAIKMLAQFDFAFQPSIKREQIESLHELGFLERAENVAFLGPPRGRQDAPGHQSCDRRGGVRTARVLRHAGRADRVALGGPGGRQPGPAASHTDPSGPAGGR